MQTKSKTSKIKRFLLKAFYCPQKIFFAGGELFFHGKPTCTKNNMVAENKKHFLKVELFKHSKKTNDLKAEANFLKFLTHSGCICHPNFIKEGVLVSNRPYFITEKINKKGEASLPDILLSVLEQQKAGIFHHDIKMDNIIFDGTLAKLIDYDQADFRNEMKSLFTKESVEYFIKNQTPNWIEDCKIQGLEGDFDKALKNCMDLFVDNSFNFEKTTLYKKMMLKNGKELPYYRVNGDGIFSEGRFNLEKIYPILNKIVFEKDEDVLDLGCNTGSLSFYLKKRGCFVHSVDVDSDALICTKILSNLQGLKIRVSMIDLEKEKFPKKYNTIFLLNDDFLKTVFLEDLDSILNQAERLVVKIKNEEELKKFELFQVKEIFEVKNEKYKIAILE